MEFPRGAGVSASVTSLNERSYGGGRHDVALVIAVVGLIGIGTQWVAWRTGWTSATSSSR